MGTCNIIQGDLFQSTEQYIAHQCNCVTQKSAHLAKSVFDRFPYADIYSKRHLNWTPPVGQCMGDIVVCGNGTSDRFIINMLAQYYPGCPKYPDSYRDGHIAREKAFQQCLKKIEQLKDLKSIGFPFQIGCGAAGGNWPSYLDMIQKFAEATPVDVRIYRLFD
jgi:O-acetyl-ADP-ribose deacetylase (regulator of RNase III)